MNMMKPLDRDYSTHYCRIEDGVLTFIGVVGFEGRQCSIELELLRNLGTYHSYQPIGTGTVQIFHGPNVKFTPTQLEVIRRVLAGFLMRVVEVSSASELTTAGIDQLVADNKRLAADRQQGIDFLSALMMDGRVGEDPETIAAILRWLKEMTGLG